MASNIKRRSLVTSAVASSLFTIVPRHVLGGTGYVAPSDRIVLAQIGCGTQGTRELVTGLIQKPYVQIAAVCDPVKDAKNYLDWGKYSVRDGIRKLLDDSAYGEGVEGLRCGRDQFQDVLQRYYAKVSGQQNYTVSSYADFRELLDKEDGIDAVKVVTPDHTHAAIAIAAMKKGKHVLLHKPLANRMSEARLMIETARRTKVVTHVLSYGRGGTSNRIVARIREGVIGPLRELHEWTATPVWPQFTERPADRPPIPEGFDWTLWLGPSLDQPYHPNYTHMVYRSWYEFGAGALGDAALYTLWPIFTALNLGPPLSARAFASHTCNAIDHTANPAVNDFSFPTASTIQFRFAARSDMPAMDLFWYEGGMRPRIPELEDDDAPLPLAGIMWVGEKGKIISVGGVPRLYTSRGVEPLWEPSPPTPAGAPRTAQTPFSENEEIFFQAIRKGEQSPGSFDTLGSISETVCLAAVALRAARIKSGSRVYPSAMKLNYDSESMQITNLPEANQYLTRDYRPGWEL